MEYRYNISNRDMNKILNYKYKEKKNQLNRIEKSYVRDGIRKCKKKKKLKIE